MNRAQPIACLVDCGTVFSQGFWKGLLKWLFDWEFLLKITLEWTHTKVFERASDVNRKVYLQRRKAHLDFQVIIYKAVILSNM